MAWADPADSDGDGISGRPSLIANPPNPSETVIGRFTYKGEQAQIEDQVATALGGNNKPSSNLGQRHNPFYRVI